jgi:hypothetical protein
LLVKKTIIITISSIWFKLLDFPFFADKMKEEDTHSHAQTRLLQAQGNTTGSIREDFLTK